MKCDPKSLRDLEARLVEAKGPSYALECAIADVLEPERDKRLPPLTYTASLDAAVGLVERVLPGQEWGVERLNDYCHAEIWYFTPERHFDTTANAPTPALALCLALVKALGANPPPHESDQPNG